MNRRSLSSAESDNLIYRLMGGGALTAIAALVLVPGRGSAIFAEPVIALVGTLFNLFGMEPLSALLLVSGILSVWIMLVGAAFAVTAINPQKLALQFFLFAVFVAAMSMWQVTIFTMYSLPGAGLPVPLAVWWMTIPGGIGVLFSAAGIVYFTGIQRLGDDSQSMAPQVPSASKQAAP